jgi:hypothetical protein
MRTLALALVLAGCAHVDPQLKRAYSIGGFPGPTVCDGAGSMQSTRWHCIQGIDAMIEDALVHYLRKNELAKMVHVEVRFVRFESLSSLTRKRLTFACTIDYAEGGHIAVFERGYEFDYEVPAMDTTVQPPVTAIDDLMKDIATSIDPKVRVLR